MMFDERTAAILKYYVYALIDPHTLKPFYVGKGCNNRVFDHAEDALTHTMASDKCNVIREIHATGGKVQHVILRHGLTEKAALEVEATLLDYASLFDHKLTNIVLGHQSIDNGAMTTDAIIGKYNAEPLVELTDPAVIININKTYIRGTGVDGIYSATHECWVMDKTRLQSITLVLPEYRGLIVEVFQVKEWYPVDTVTANGKSKVRWGFDGRVAGKHTRNKYINKSVAHLKRKGSSNPIRYTL